MAHAVSPLAPAEQPRLPVIAGVKLAATATGIRYKGRPDVLLALLDEGTAAAGCLTRSKSSSAPVDWCKAALKLGKARALLVNAGNANAFTGKAGTATVKAVAAAASKAFKSKPGTIYQASTGVIGEPLDPSFIVNAIPELTKAAVADGWDMAARAIMTTDTFPKVSTRTAKLDGRSVTINGIAKGSGMIAPDMATMLSFIFTDAAIPPKILQALLSASVDKTFNCVTVDGDTSTSDTVLLFATGAAGPVKGLKTAADVRLKGFAKALHEVCHDLALQVAKDGEGAEKLIDITVTGAENDKAAHRIAMSIANSPLVKTAIAGEDANWGPHRHGDRQGGREGDPRQDPHPHRRRAGGSEGHARQQIRRSRNHAAHEGPRHQDRGGCRSRQGQSAGVDLRSHPPLHRHQRLLPQLMRLVLVAAVALIDADGRVLLSQRPEGKTLAGLWEFPGGKIEAGERPETALIRELKEELGIDVAESCVAPLTFASHAYSDFHLLMPLYVCRRWKGQVQAMEGQVLKWVRAKDMRSYPMPPADLPLIPHLEELL